MTGHERLTAGPVSFTTVTSVTVSWSDRTLLSQNTQYMCRVHVCVCVNADSMSKSERNFVETSPGRRAPMDDTDDAFCAICSIHFSNSATLAKHCAAIHQASAAPSPPAPAAAAAPATREKRPAGSSIPVESEQIELAPLLAVLSDQQKDAILLRAVQHEPDFFYDRIFEQATAPLTDEAANARLTSMDPEAFASAIKFF